MTDSFTNIGLVGKFRDPRVGDSMLTLAAHLCDRGVRVLVATEVELDFGTLAIERLAEDALIEQAELLVAIGGDGTILYATRLVARRDIPLLGINRGRLGFLADVSPNDMLERLDDVLAGKFSEESRLLLKAEICHPGQSPTASVALNDVVIQKVGTGRMLDFATWVDKRYVNTHGGDGLIVATPTGSTAYALSCGGPIVHPEVDALVLAPICPHTLSDRPIVIRSEGEIEVRTPEGTDARAQVTCDGHVLGELAAGERLRITQADRRIRLIHPPGHDYYRILRSKLHWGRGSHGRSEDRGNH